MNIVNERVYEMIKNEILQDAIKLGQYLEEIEVKDDKVNDMINKCDNIKGRLAEIMKMIELPDKS